MSELAERIDRLESIGAITDLIHAYARAVRRQEPEHAAALFVPAGTFELRDGHPDRAEFTVRQRFESSKALLDYLREGKGKPHPIPLIHNVMVELDGDTATANSMMAAPIHGTDHEIFGEYRDNLVRTEGRWRFSARIFTIYTS